MWKSFYEGSGLLHLPLLAMFLFMGAFAMAVVRAFRRHGAEDPAAALPLNEDISVDQSMTAHNPFTASAARSET